MTPCGCHDLSKAAVGVVPFPELPRLYTSIARFLEQAWHCWGIPQEGKHGVPIHAFRRIIAADIVLMSVETGEKRCEAGSTQRSRHIAIRKHRPFGRKLVQAGRLNNFVA